MFIIKLNLNNVGVDDSVNSETRIYSAGKLARFKKIYEDSQKAYAANKTDEDKQTMAIAKRDYQRNNDIVKQADVNTNRAYGAVAYKSVNQFNHRNDKVNKSSKRYDPEIAKLQKDLVSKGFDIRVDGIDGPNTQKALDGLSSANVAGRKAHNDYSNGGTYMQNKRAIAEVDKAFNDEQDATYNPAINAYETAIKNTKDPVKITSYKKAISGIKDDMTTASKKVHDDYVTFADSEMQKGLDNNARSTYAVTKNVNEDIKSDNYIRKQLLINLLIVNLLKLVKKI